MDIEYEIDLHPHDIFGHISAGKVVSALSGLVPPGGSVFVKASGKVVLIERDQHGDVSVSDATNVVPLAIPRTTQ